MARAFVYMLVNYKGGAIYTGLTKDLPSRVHDHKIKRDPKSFTSIYNIHRLVWFEDFDDTMRLSQLKTDEGVEASLENQHD